MPITKDVLQGFRNRGYSENRVLSLTPEELKQLPVDQENGEICLIVYGTLSGSDFQVSRVEAEESEPSTEGPPDRAMPSPS